MFVSVLAVVVILVGVVVINGSGTENMPGAQGAAITVYKSPTCGCCDNYVAYLKRRGLAVTVVDELDLAPIKMQYKIPGELQSCHTAVIGGYVVEGHIPTEVIQKLLDEKPDIAGIALAGMPMGSPGMPGGKSGQFMIHAIAETGEDNGVFIEY